MNDTWPKSRIQKGGSLEARVWLSRLNWSRASEGKWKYEKLVGEEYPATRGTMREQTGESVLAESVLKSWMKSDRHNRQEKEVNVNQCR